MTDSRTSNPLLLLPCPFWEISMPTEVALPKDSPLMQAWEKYKASTEYANTRGWALHELHVDGSLWAAFMAGWNAAHAPVEPPYRVQSFWSPCKRYIATACVSHENIALVDDDGRVWEATGPEQDIARAEGRSDE